MMGQEAVQTYKAVEVFQCLYSSTYFSILFCFCSVFEKQAHLVLK